MNTADNIKNRLDKLCNENKIQTLFFNEESEVLIILNLETVEYRGVYIKYEQEGSVIEINTATNSLKVNDNGVVSRTKIDPLIKKSLDKVTVSKFNVNKIDEDYFSDLENVFEDDIVQIQDEKTKKIYKKVKETLKEIQDKDYDKYFIIDQLKRFDFVAKKDHFNLERYIDSSKIKYNSLKNKITVRNDYNFKEKFSFTDVVNDFDTALFLEIVREYYRKKEFDQRRMSLDDAFIDGYPVFTHTAALGDKDKNYDKQNNN